MSKAAKVGLPQSAMGVLLPGSEIIQGVKAARKDKDGKPLPEETTPVAQAKRATDIETREHILLAQARAGGAVRPDNEADLLQYNDTRARRRNVARTLLG